MKNEDNKNEKRTSMKRKSLEKQIPNKIGQMSSLNSGNRLAAFTLVVLTPLIAELALGSTPIRMAWLILLWLPIYGSGILLVREAVRRTNRSWPSIVLLGLAYELAEDGIGLQALTSPHLYGAADWGARILGLNFPYWEANAMYHIIFSSVIPIFLTDLLFPSHRNFPYLKKTGMITTGIVAIFGVVILRITVPPTQDPGYTAPLPVIICFTIAILILSFIALKVIPPQKPMPYTANSVPPIWLLSIIGFFGVIFLLALTFPFGSAKQPGFTKGLWVLLPMILALILASSMYLIIKYWSKSIKWTNVHALSLIGGACVGHTVAGIFVANTYVDRIGLIIIAILTTVLLFLLGQRIQRSN
ncbi:hypothetical protein MK805_12460 [Shimazuella sp. AN120528]|uniref:hypothetical protein n=1 Tax=Shimazuella soli TaxID=1892854 RepID=UPI001F117009|nr:hypothetical protein [Shimazuella soli]MCH5585756.1 hypothetical protein [Shimazuella soli]